MGIYKDELKTKKQICLDLLKNLSLSNTLVIQDKETKEFLMEILEDKKISLSEKIMYLQGWEDTCKTLSAFQFDFDNR